MKKFLLLFCLGLIFSSSIHSQAVILNNSGEQAFCTTNTSPNDPNEVIITEDEFNNLTDVQLEAMFIKSNPNIITPCNNNPTVRIIRRFRGQTISSSRNSNGIILGTLDFGFDSGNCAGQNISLTFRTPDSDSIPTLSQWGLMIFGLIVLNMGCVFVIENKKILA